jgi:hypothetical protein
MARSGIIRQIVDGHDLDLREFLALQSSPKYTSADPAKAVDPYFDGHTISFLKEGFEPSGILLKISPIRVLVKIFPKKDVDFIIERTL